MRIVLTLMIKYDSNKLIINNNNYNKGKYIWQ